MGAKDLPRITRGRHHNDTPRQQGLSADLSRVWGRDGKMVSSMAVLLHCVHSVCITPASSSNQGRHLGPRPYQGKGGRYLLTIPAIYSSTAPKHSNFLTSQIGCSTSTPWRSGKILCIRKQITESLANGSNGWGWHQVSPGDRHSYSPRPKPRRISLPAYL